MDERREELKDQLLTDDKAIMRETKKMDQLVPYGPLEREEVRRKKEKVKAMPPPSRQQWYRMGFVRVVGPAGSRMSSKLNWALTTIANNTLEKRFRKGRTYNYPGLDAMPSACWRPWPRRKKRQHFPPAIPLAKQVSTTTFSSFSPYSVIRSSWEQLVIALLPYDQIYKPGGTTWPREKHPLLWQHSGSLLVVRECLLTENHG